MRNCQAIPVQSEKADSRICDICYTTKGAKGQRIIGIIPKKLDSSMFDFLSKKFSSIFSSFTGQKHLDANSIQDALNKVEDALLEADVPYEVVKSFVAQVKNEAIGRKVIGTLDPGKQFIKIVHEQLKMFLGGQGVFSSFQIPSVIMVMGLQGSGKTTSLAKMAYYSANQAKQRGKKRHILCASVDFYRPAAIDQLEILAGRIGVDFYRSAKNNPIDAARDILDHMRKGGYELLFLDTAGRLHIDEAMLQELQDIESLLKPRYKIFVIDAMTGQESLKIAQAFDRSVGFNAALLTKVDSDTRGGASFAFRYVQKKPIFFVGTGEKLEDLELFHPDRMAGRILGMGDVVTLAEKAEQVIKKEEQEAAHKALMQGKFTLQDFADQISMVNKLGSLSTIAHYLPGLAGGGLTPEMVHQGERDMVKFRAIIQSMTPKERSDARMLDQSRIKRVASGAGVRVDDVKSLLLRFEQSQQYAKLFKRFFRGQSRP